MVDKGSGDKTLTLTSSKTLTLKRSIDPEVVSQRFSHGRSKRVVVERVKHRGTRKPGESENAAPQGSESPSPSTSLKKDLKKSLGLLHSSGGLSDDERHARLTALTEAQKRQASTHSEDKEDISPLEEGIQDESFEPVQEFIDASPEPNASESPAVEIVPEDLKTSDLEIEEVPEIAPAPEPVKENREHFDSQKRPVPPRSTYDSRRMRPTVVTMPAAPKAHTPPQPVPQAPPPKSPPGEGYGARDSRRTLVPRDDDMRDDSSSHRSKGRRSSPGGAEESAKWRGRLTVTSALASLDSVSEERTYSEASHRRRLQRNKKNTKREMKEKLSREVVVPENITVQELANRMSERVPDILRLLAQHGLSHQSGDLLDADTAQLVAEELGHTVKRVAEADVEDVLFKETDDPALRIPRPPIVTIMGHVDHGKTSLLDALRTTDVVSGEAGGITQHIGAYQVKTRHGGKITFIDTPGHEAFTAMRARGARVTDIVVLVVAGDDGVMPQTREAITHAQDAEVPIIVAINKMDKPDADPQRVRTELLSHGIVVESMGGEVLEVEISAKKKTNLDKLQEAILLQSEILDLRANPNIPADGAVIEARLDRGRGPVVTLLVQKGTLKTGDIVIAGHEWGRVRSMVTDTGVAISEAGPSMAVEVLGFNSVPQAGDRVSVVKSEGQARDITEYRDRQRRDTQAAAQGAGRSLLTVIRDLKAAETCQALPIIVKSDVQGSTEAIVAALERLKTDEVRVRIVSSGVGGISPGDVTLAAASNAMILAFNVRAHKEAKDLMTVQQNPVVVRYYRVIYDLINDVKKAMSDLLEPEIREHTLGSAQVLEVFNVSKVGKIAGCRVTEGVVQRGAYVRLVRNAVVIFEGKLAQLKRFKDDAKEVVAGQECGVALEGYQDISVGDIVECYRTEAIQRSL
jgi:translation initiation factor IF-2